MFTITRNINLFGGPQNAIIFNHFLTSDGANTHPFHSHDFCEICVFISGDIGYIVEDSYYELEYGDIMLLQPNEIHKVVIKKRIDYERFYISFPLGCFGALNEGITSPLDCIMGRRYGTRNLLPVSDGNFRTCVNILYSISGLITRSQPGWELMAYSQLLQFLMIINSCFSQHVYVPKKITLPPLLDGILAYVNSRVSSIDSEETIAKEFGISASYLSRLFKKNMDVSLSQYIRAKRISHAKLLLTNGATVTEACYESGFNDCSHFITVFRQFVGMTPYKYKNDTRPSV